jgi:hypothetical protein
MKCQQPVATVHSDFSTEQPLQSTCADSSKSLFDREQGMNSAAEQEMCEGFDSVDLVAGDNIGDLPPASSAKSISAIESQSHLNPSSRRGGNAKQRGPNAEHKPKTTRTKSKSKKILPNPGHEADPQPSSTTSPSKSRKNRVTATVTATEAVDSMVAAELKDHRRRQGQQISSTGGGVVGVVGVGAVASGEVDHSEEATHFFVNDGPVVDSEACEVSPPSIPVDVGDLSGDHPIVPENAAVEITSDHQLRPHMRSWVEVVKESLSHNTDVEEKRAIGTANKSRKGSLRSDQQSTTHLPPPLDSASHSKDPGHRVEQLKKGGGVARAAA